MPVHPPDAAAGETVVTPSSAGGVFPPLPTALPAPDVYARPARHVALLIGNGRYPHAAVTTVASDIRLIAAGLRHNGYDVTVLENLNRDEMTAAVTAFAVGLGQDTIAVFYYAGHAIQHDERNFLVPIDANIVSGGGIRQEAMDLGLVTGALSARGGRSVILLDAGRASVFETFRGGFSGLARFDTPRDSLAGMAAAPGTIARNGSGPNSRFAAALGAALQRPQDGFRAMLNDVRREIAEATNGEQRPWVASTLTDDIALGPGGRSAPGPVLVTGGLPSPPPSAPRAPERQRAPSVAPTPRVEPMAMAGRAPRVDPRAAGGPAPVEAPPRVEPPPKAGPPPKAVPPPRVEPMATVGRAPKVDPPAADGPSPRGDRVDPVARPAVAQPQPAPPVSPSRTPAGTGIDVVVTPVGPASASAPAASAVYAPTGAMPALADLPRLPPLPVVSTIAASTESPSTPARGTDPRMPPEAPSRTDARPVPGDMASPSASPGAPPALTRLPAPSADQGPPPSTDAPSTDAPSGQRPDLPPALRAATPPRAEEEARAWSELATSADPSAFEAFLSRHPNGAHAPMARAKLDALMTARVVAEGARPAAAPADGAAPGSPDACVLTGAGVEDVAACRSCHTFDLGKASRPTGPNLSGVFGQRAAQVGDFKGYSPSLLAAADRGVTWTETALDEYLRDPRAFLVRVTGNPDVKHNMFFKMPDEAHRARVIAYLRAIAACR